MEKVVNVSLFNLKNGNQTRRFLVLAFTLGLMAQCAVGQRASTASPASTDTAKQKTLVVLGDSLAAGYGIDPAEAYPAVLQRFIDDARLGYRVVNAGVSGDTSAGALRRVDWMLRRPVDALLVEIGGNDGLRGQSPSALKTNLTNIIERTRAKYPEARIVLAGMKMPSNMGEYATHFEQVFVEVAKQQRVSLIPFLLEGVGGVPEMNLPDGIHPTPEGHRRVATNVWTVLGPVLKRASTEPGHP